MAGFRHIVLLHWQDGTTDAQIDAVHDALTKLPAGIAGLRSYDIRRDAGISEGNAHFSVVADFDDQASYEAYAVDAEHVRIIQELIRPIVAQRTATQHELT